MLTILSQRASAEYVFGVPGESREKVPVSHDVFVTHTAESAPADARATVEGVERKFGFIPAPVGRMATSRNYSRGS